MFWRFLLSSLEWAQLFVFTKCKLIVVFLQMPCCHGVLYIECSLTFTAISCCVLALISLNDCVSFPSTVFADIWQQINGTALAVLCAVFYVLQLLKNTPAWSMARVRNFRSVEQKINSQLLLLLLLLLLQHSYSAQIQASSSPLIYEFLTSQKLVWVGHIA